MSQKYMKCLAMRSITSFEFFINQDLLVISITIFPCLIRYLKFVSCQIVIFEVSTFKLTLFFRFSADNANFSLNTDDPTVTGMNLSQEYEFLANRVKLPFRCVARAVSLNLIY